MGPFNSTSLYKVTAKGQVNNIEIEIAFFFLTINYAQIF